MYVIYLFVRQGLSSADKKLSNTMFLPLAERMTKKYIDDGKVSAEEEVELMFILNFRLIDYFMIAIN